MKNFKITALIISLLFTFGSVNAQFGKSKFKANKFASSIEKKKGPIKVKVPYTDMISYFGHAAPGNEDAIVDGKKFYYLYVWVPAVAPELGIRMMSPAPDAKKSKIKEAIQSDAYKKNAKSKDYFDTYITIERSSIIQKSKVTPDGVKNAKWFKLASNDDSGEMPKQPSGSSYNSLMRYKSVVGNPTKALTTGLYRIGYTTYKRGEVKGTFLAQVAAPIKLPGVAIAKTVEELVKMMK